MEISLSNLAETLKHLIAPETGSPACTRTRLAQSSDLELKPPQATELKLTQATLLGFLS